ncbi:flagellar protein FlgN [Microvirga alba]|uniref:Flagellar protein FlgN n=1 Tax=Microvirga alba TaxID=2791025 RepID=A0A931FQ56_9HYPH|nr:flagellar protein FlgN [Microvirga alba]MBF9235639.1 flagellar protein FlgN [Microvirga alba]
MLIQSIERLEDTIEAETIALLSHSVVDQEEFNRRKSQSLLELSRLVRVIQDEPVDPDLIARLTQLQMKLEQNHSVIEMHLRAVQEVSEIVSGAIRSADSDGTYSAGLYPQG